MGTISVSHLGKAYKQYPSRWTRLAEWLIPFYPQRHTLKWILQDINFTVQPGEAIGIIGINGAGKSTLLKMITGTTLPTTGQVHMTGRVAAMLELGMGFHPDFTGRQNAFMAGQLLGYTPDEIQRLMPEIEAFAEIGSYIDEPVRVYSSGMQMRLAFSVATAIRPDILIVDEALSVGDAYFVHKSFDRIRKFREQGTTLLIVSHDKQAIQSICDRAILLSAGRLALEGNPEAVMDYYNALLANHQNQTVKQEITPDGKVQTVSGTGEAVVRDITLLNDKHRRVEMVDIGEKGILRHNQHLTDTTKRCFNYLPNSTSWRVTAPLRWLSRVLHKLLSLSWRVIRSEVRTLLLPLMRFVLARPSLRQTLSAVLKRSPSVAHRLHLLAIHRGLVPVPATSATSAPLLTTPAAPPGRPLTPHAKLIFDKLKIAVGQHEKSTENL